MTVDIGIQVDPAEMAKVIAMFDQLACRGGNHGFIRIKEIHAKTYLRRDVIIAIGRALGLHVEPHGKYGYCAGAPRADKHTSP